MWNKEEIQKNAMKINSKNENNTRAWKEGIFVYTIFGVPRFIIANVIRKNLNKYIIKYLSKNNFIRFNIYCFIM